MTNEQYQKRIQFLEHIKKNYAAVKDKALLFYFDDYDIDTILAKFIAPSSLTKDYFRERRSQIDGAVCLSYDYDGLVYLSLTDAFVNIRYNITSNFYENNDLDMPLDMKKVAAELKELFELLKSK